MLRVHFLNVGHGDCTIIEHPSGRLTMIDINNSQEYDKQSFAELLEEVKARRRTNALGALVADRSGLLAPFGGNGALYAAAVAAANEELTDPIAFMATHYKGRRLWRYIQTHPDLDHMRGLRRLYETVGIDNFWDTQNTREVHEFKNDADKADWEFYQKLRTGSVGPKVLNYTQGDAVFAFAREEDGRPGGDNIEILSPTPELVDAHDEDDERNNISIVLRVNHATRSVLLPGDAGESAWDSMRRLYGARLKSDFLKASHHGRDSGYNLEAVKLIAPRLTFVSVGRKPDTDATSKYRQQCPRVASTRYHGNMELRIHDNGSWEWFVQQNPDT